MGGIRGPGLQADGDSHDLTDVSAKARVHF